ncbi:meiosis-specific nuclear structural protein 1 [Parasteatoda tepidariorum]|uniref:meiosis-specific nuclear structural protein 1 n=1 Tax=Parasteatoda tepidariorum TaxID=114398 RepID=UPI001C71DAD2|nr:meiosis-specific nuclear structural protein 1 [Parasteatoda tepidariorum]
MLGLLKECDRQIQQQREKLLKGRDLALQEKFRQLDQKRSIPDYFSSGENEINKLQIASKSHIDIYCNQNIKRSEKSLSKEVGEKRSNKVREEKIRQLLWKNAPELQNLRKMILAADVCREQALQMAEKNALRELEDEQKKHLAEISAKEKAALEAEERDKDFQEMRAKQKYHRELDEQLRFKRTQESSDDGQAERERAAIDEIKRQIEEEDLKEARAKIEKQNELRRQMSELLMVREELRSREKLREVSESLKVDEYRKAQELRAKGQEEKRQLELEQRLQIQEELLDFLEQICREKMKWDELRTELAIEQREEEERERFREEEMKRKKFGKDLQKVYDMQLKVKRQKEDLQKKEDELFRQRMMRQLHEEDKLEQMGAQKRRQKQLEHKHQVESLLNENRLKKAAEKSREMADQDYQMKVEAERVRMVEEERIRFLKEHASDLLGYLPKGIFTDKETLEHLGEKFKKFYYPSE